MKLETRNLKLETGKRQPATRIHKAGWVVVDPRTVIQDGYVKVESGLIKEVGQGKKSGTENVIDHGPGVIMPALVNAHTHLELSMLKGRISFEKGFQAWVAQLIKQREEAGAEALIKGAKKGIKELADSGCGIIGEVSTLGLTLEAFSRSGLSGVWFKEYFGEMNPEISHFPFLTSHFSLLTSHFSLASLAGHAPHTTSPDFLAALKNAAKKHNLPFSIHLGESEDETEFLTTGKGRWADFLSERGINFSDWGLPVESTVKYMEQIGVLDEKTLAVHLISAKQDDFETLLRHKVNVCLCLRSNKNLHNRLPDIEGMLKAGIKPCLGTDSLASTESLSMFDEMAFVSGAFPCVPPEDILAMATINGAKALGMENSFGSLVPGKYGAFIYVPMDISSDSEMIEQIVNKAHDRLSDRK
ncbi:MAG: amidohydrolase family protein [Desulfobacteraceae bacterium]|nr:amidohydrolase family protein [Desulfobacteraceae bacterium]